MNRDNFKWTTELVEEFAVKVKITGAKEWVRPQLEEFIASHTSAIEEREGRDWEIVAIKSKFNEGIARKKLFHFEKKSEWLFTWDVKEGSGVNGGQYYEDYLLYNGNTIHSVLRKRDNSVWTVGEGTMDGVIERFELYNEYHIKVWLNGNKYLWFHTLEKFPQPLPQRTKPPLGVIPKWLHNEKRLQELDEAIVRYTDDKKFVPIEWIVESYELREWLKNRESEKKLNIEG